MEAYLAAMEDAETVAFGIAVAGAAGMRGGFSIAEVAEAEASWSVIDANLAIYGFIVRLVGGYWRYIELTLDDTMATKGQAEIELTELDEGERPELSGIDWSDDVERLNNRLAQLKRQ